MEKTTNQYFTKKLMVWEKTVDRPMPWKGEKDPYLVWLSEIILQQTRVEQGWAYFEKFKKHYPSVHDLAAAGEDELMKMWEGLGYYSRARNLHYTAKYISKELGGKFPDDYKAILALKGVGKYTAAAVASFVYGLPYAVLDGNVYRVLSRFFGIETPTDTTKGKAFFEELAGKLLEQKAPGIYNQAIMDFGAMVCKPKRPDCKTCPLRRKCVAYEKGLVAKLPIKSKKIERKSRFFNYLQISSGNQVMIHKRAGKDIWKNLYQYPLLETSVAPENFDALKLGESFDFLGKSKKFDLKRMAGPYKQSLTHQHIWAYFWEIELKPDENVEIPAPFIFVSWKELHKFAFPKIFSLYFNDKSLYLNLF